MLKSSKLTDNVRSYIIINMCIFLTKFSQPLQPWAFSHPLCQLPPLSLLSLDDIPRPLSTIQQASSILLLLYYHTNTAILRSSSSPPRICLMLRQWSCVAIIELLLYAYHAYKIFNEVCVWFSSCQINMNAFQYDVSWFLFFPIMQKLSLQRLLKDE